MKALSSLALAATLLAATSARAAEPPTAGGAYASVADGLATATYRVVGVELRVAPETVAVPRGLAGSVRVDVVTGSGAESAATRALAAGAHVEATLRGPSFPAQRVVGAPNAPLLLPPLPLSGDYALDGIRLVDTATGETRLEGSPPSVPVTVFDEVLVARVTSRPLTLDEIEALDIAIDASSFGATEFEVAFVIDGQQIPVHFPVVSPRFDEATEIVPAAELDELLAQAEAMNALLAEKAALPPELMGEKLDVQVQGVIFQKVDSGGDDDQRNLPGVPGLLVIPGHIGFLHQFFSVQVYVQNAAPAGSGLSLHGLTAALSLPPGRDLVPGTDDAPGDDPLRMARVGPERLVQRVVPIRSLGPDGVAGSADDGVRLMPGETGQGELLVEGLREGLHRLDVRLGATLDGLAAGEVAIEGDVAGSVLVRNPRFSIVFAHPRTIRADEPYEAAVTVLNTGDTVANLASVTLARGSIAGATLVGDETVTLGDLAPGESATATFELVARKTGYVTFSNLTGDDEVTGSFDLRMGVDERGVALSPAAIGYPDHVDALPESVRRAANRVLGQALSVATAPQLPPGVAGVDRATVLARVLELAEAGQRLELGDAAGRVVADLLLDWQGGRRDSAGFDQILRETDAGRLLRDAVTAALEGGDDPADADAAARLALRAADLAGRHEPWRVLAASEAGIAPRLARLGQEARVADSDVPGAMGYAGARGAWLVARPEAADAGPDTLRWDAPAGHAAGAVSALTLGADGAGALVRWALPAESAAVCYRADAGSAALAVDRGCDGASDGALTGVVTAVAERAPGVVAVRQELGVIAGRPYPSCYRPDYKSYGTVVAVVYDKPMDEAGAGTATAYRLEDGTPATGARLQPGGRVVYVNLRRPIGTLAPHDLVLDGVRDPAGRALPPTTRPIALSADVGVALHGRVLGLDGAPVAGIPVTITENDQMATPLGCIGVDVRVTQTLTDADGAFAFDWLMAGVPITISATDTSGLDLDALGSVLSSVSGDAFSERRLAEAIAAAPDAEALLAAFSAGSLGQAVVKARGLDRAVLRDHVPADSPRVGTDVPVVLRFRGRGTVVGRVLAADGVSPVTGAAVNLFPDADSREKGRGVFSGADGAFAFAGVPLGAFSLDVKTGTGLARTVSGVLTEPGEAQVVDVVLSAAPVLRGTVRVQVVESDGVTPHPGARAYVQDFGGGVRAQGVTGGDGLTGELTVPVDDGYGVAAVSFDGRRLGKVFGLSVTLGATTWARVTLQGTATVSGRVQYANGLPAAGALVAGGEGIVTTDADGLFVLAGVPTGDRAIAAAVVKDPARGIPFTRLGSARVTVTGSGDSFALITLEEVGRIEGFVRSGLGAPVGGVDVAIPVTGGFFVTKASPAGFYAFDRLGLGGYTLSAPAPPVDEDVREQLDAAPTATPVDELSALLGLATTPLRAGTGASPGVWGYTRTRLDFDGQVRAVDIQYLPKGRVSGVVKNHRGTPIGAWVTARGLGRSKNGAPVMTILAEGFSDAATGVFDLGTALFPGPYTVSATSPFYPAAASVTGETTTAAPDATGLALAFADPTSRQSRLTGTVLLPSGEPVGAGARVGISWAPDYAVETDASGRFDTQIDLPASTYTVTARDPGTGYQGQVQVTARPPATDFTVQLLGLGGAEITVTSDAGEPVEGARVELSRPAFPVTTLTATTGADGVARVADLVEGTYYLSACQLGATVSVCGAGRVVVPLAGTGLTDVVLDPIGAIEGTFVQADGHTPVPFAQVVVKDLGLAVTDAAGRFAFAEVPVGAWEITGQDAATGRYARTTVVISAAGQVAHAALVVKALGTVSGIVLDSDGATPATAATVTLRSSDPLTPPRVVTTDPVGAYRFPGVPVGAFTVAATHAVLVGVTAQAGGVLPEGQPEVTVDLQLTPLATLSVTVLRPDGQTPAALAQVRAGSTVKQAGPDGRATFTGLRLGRVALQATSSEPGETRSRAVGSADLAAPGVAPEATLVLGGVGAVAGTVVDADGAPAAGVSVWLRSRSQVAAGDVDLVLTDATGAFLIEDVPPGEFELAASDGTTGASAEGVVAGDGDVVEVALTLGATGSVAGRIVLETDGSAVVGAAVTVRYAPPVGGAAHGVRTVVTGSDGRFAIDAVPLGALDVAATENARGGVAYRAASLSAPGEALDLGDVALDLAYPRVTAVAPADGAGGVPVDAVVRLTFSEPLDAASLRATGLQLIGPAGAREVTLAYAEVAGDAPGGVVGEVTLAPTSPLESQVSYQIVARGGLVQSGPGVFVGPLDRVGRPLLTTFTASFTTADGRPPALVSLTPADGAVQVAPTTPLRLVFDEPVRRDGVTMALTRVGGAAVTGRVDRGLGDTALVFTPDAPLAPNARYAYSVDGVQDLAGNAAAGAPFTGAFATVDTIGPALAGVGLAGGAPPLGGQTVTAVAALVTPEDGARVRFSLGGQVVAETAPGTLSAALALPLSGTVLLSAEAIDAFGNHGAPVSTPLVIVQVPLVVAGPDLVGAEGATLRLASTFTDALSGAHHATVDWGDGSPLEDVAAADLAEPGAGPGRVTAAHVYADDGDHDVVVCVHGAAPYPGCARLIARVDNAAPTMTALTGLVVDEGTTGAIAVATFHDAGTADTHTATADLGAGPRAATVVESPHGPPGDAAGLDGEVRVAAGASFADDGQTAIAVRVTDDDGATAEATAVVTVRNVAPTVSAGPDQLLSQQAGFTRQGTFADPGADTFTATVDWGAGAGEEPLALGPGRAFTLDHAYGAVGAYAVTVRVRDDDGGVGVAGFVITVESLPTPVLTTPQELLVAPGLTAALPVRANLPAPPGGLVVSLASSASGVASVPATVTIPAGAVVVNAPVTGVAVGSATVTASAPGWEAAATTVAVVAASVALAPATDYPLAVGDARAQQVSLTTPAPAGGLVVTLASSDPGVTVAPPTVTVPAGQITAPTPVTVTAVAPATATVTASASGLTPASVVVTAAVPALEVASCGAATVTGVGLYHETCLVRTRVAGQLYDVTAPLVVGVAASAGRAEASATVAAGTHQSALRLAGLVAGEDTLTLGASGWTSATLAVTVEPTALAWQGVETQRTTVSAPDDVTLAPTIAHPVGHTLRAVAAMTAAVGVAPGATAGGVRVEDAGGAEVSTVTIPAGAASASLSVATPATAGAYRLRATRDGASYDSAEVTVAALSYALEIACGVDTRVALGFEHRSCYARRRLNGVTHNGPSALPVTLSTATGAATAGSVTIPAGQNAAYFTLGGVSLGDDVVTASDASGTYAPASVAVTVVDGAFAWVGVDVARNTASARDDVYLYFRTPGSTTNLTARVGGPLALSLTEATAPDMVSFYAAASGGAAITSLPVSAGATSATIWVGTPSAPGTYRIHAALGSATGDSPAVTVDPPAYGLTLGGCPSGAATGVALLNDTCYVRRTLNGAFHSAATPLTVTFASATGAASVASVTIPANQSLAYLEVVGVAAGADTVTAAASGTSLAYPTATLPVSVVAPTVVWVGVDTPRNPLSSRDDLYARLDAQGFVLKPAVPLTVTASVAEATPPGIVALYPASTGTTPATTWTWPARTQYLPTVWVGQPATTGSYRVRLETPGVFVGDSPPVTVEPPVLTLRLPSCNGTTQTTARHLVNAGCYVRTTLNGATYAVPEPLTVTFASSAPDVVAPPPSVTIAAGQSSGAFDLTGVGLGSSVVTASAPGYASPESVPVVSGAGELVFSNIPSVVPFNGATWYVYTREVGGPYRAVAEALTIDVEAASPLVTVAPQVVVPARQQLVYGVRAWASGTGSTTVTASAPDFQPVMATVAASVASTGIAVPPGEELLTYLPGVTATASSQYAAANAPRAAVDHDLGTYWRSASHAADAPQWLELALPSEATVTALWYQPGAVATYAPAVATFTFYGADDAELGALEDVALPASGGPVALGPGAPIAGVVLVRMDVTAPAAQQHLYDDVGEIVLVGTED